MSVSSIKISALDALRALGQKKSVPGSTAIAVQLNDPAIAGAKIDKNVVKLGFDPKFSEVAEMAASLKSALERAESEFATCQSLVREYGYQKRNIYNETFKSNVTTVCVPFTVNTPSGHETEYVQVICSNKYSVKKETVLNNQAILGEHFDRLFTVKEEKKLRPNTEEIVRNLLTETAGLKGEELENAMESLFETEKKISTTENFESEERKLPDALRTILKQAVSRSQPGLKF